MGELKYFFFDTYALHEVAEGGMGYVKYLEDVGIVTTKLNLMELYYTHLMKDKKDVAEALFERFREFCAELTDDIIKQAMQKKAELKLLKRSSNLSYVDCVGYTVAQRLKIPFLTGDKEFANLENVEFVK